MFRLSTRLGLTVITVAAVVALSAIQIASASSSSPYWEKNGTTIFYNDGNVGIGTTTPLSELHIKQGSAGYLSAAVYGGAGLFVENSGASVIQIGTIPTDWTAIQMGDRDSPAAGKILYHNADNRMAFYTNDTEKMRLASNGNLGIGTKTPDRKLVINQGSSGNGIGLMRDGYDQYHISLTEGALRVRNETDGRSELFLKDGKLGIMEGNPLSELHIKQGAAGFDASDIYDGAGLFVENSGASVIQLGTLPTDWMALRMGDRDSPSAGQILYSNADDHLALYTNGSEQVRVSSVGFMGLGTGTPLNELHIKQGSAGFASGDVYGGAGLFVENSGASVIQLGTVSSDWAGLQMGDKDSPAAGQILYHNADNRMAFYAAGEEKWRLTSNGNVGIGTTSPSEKLDVAGNIKASGTICDKNGCIGNPDLSGYLRRDQDIVFTGFERSIKKLDMLGGTNDLRFFGNDDGITDMYIAENGNIGIGTMSTNDGYKLSVNGKVRATEVVVYSTWADYVFEEGYNLMPLGDVASYIQANKHLPNVKPAAEIEANGVSVGETQAKLLEKIEELTLYAIEQEGRLDGQAGDITELKQQNAALQAQVDQLIRSINAQ